MSETATLTGSPAPVMDVVAPPVEKTEKNEKRDVPAQTVPEIDPLEQLVAEDQADQHKEKTNLDEAATPAKKASSSPQPAKSTATQHSGIGLAITATVIIVLGLAVLATFAYIQTNR